MGVLDDVRCNNDLFGRHKGETHCTDSLNSVFPGSIYEITPTGRLELLESRHLVRRVCFIRVVRERPCSRSERLLIDVETASKRDLEGRIRELRTRRSIANECERDHGPDAGGS